MNITTLLEQENILQFNSFTHQTAWELGTKLKQCAEKCEAPVIIEIFAFGQLIFSYALPGSTLDNVDWIQRKRNTVLRYGHSSLYIGEHTRLVENRPFEELQHINHKQYCAHGGSFPIRLKNSGLIGAVTISGLPQHEDHALIIEAITSQLGE